MARPVVYGRELTHCLQRSFENRNSSTSIRRVAGAAGALETRQRESIFSVHGELKAYRGHAVHDLHALRIIFVRAPRLFR